MKSLILCEGKHDKDFLESLIKHIGDKYIGYIDIEKIGNKSSFFKIETYEQKQLIQRVKLLYKKVLFVVDSDYIENDNVYGGYKNTEDNIKNIIKKLDLNDKADYYIMCEPSSKNGYLESFLLSTLNSVQKECIENFLKCSEFRGKENHKAIVHQIYKTGYPDKSFDFSHNNFDELKEKIQNLIRE
ncbi:MAG TPA: hypothetical protein EYG73_03965 [Arcobacter sp.]|nr:hypothetical protein [Arcobacter sp.]